MDVRFFVVLSTFDLGLLRYDIVCCLVAAFYLCVGDLDKQDKFDKLKYQIMVVSMLEELELQIF